MLSFNNPIDFDCSKGKFPPERPKAYTITEEVNQTAREMRDTIDRLLRFEARVKKDVEDMLSHVTSDNVIFKSTMRDAWVTFIDEVKNEVNLFEGNVDASMTLFKSDLETNYSTLSEDTKTQITGFSNEINAKIDEFEKKYEEAFATLSTNIQEQYDSYVEAVNSRIDSNNTTHEQAFADYQQKLTTEINMFEATVNTNYETFCESVNTTITTFKETWEDIIQERLNSQDAKLDDAELYMRTNLTATVTTLIGDMQSNGEFTEIIEGEVFNDLQSKSVEVVNVVKLGVDNTGENDCSDALNTIIEEAVEGSTIYLPCGTYKVDSPIVIDKKINFVCEGTIHATTTAFTITSSFSNFDIDTIIGEGSGNGIEVGGDVLVQHNHFNIGIISDFDNCIYVSPDGENGVQYCVFDFKQLRDSDVAIMFQCGDNSIPWISENIFNGGRLKTTTAVKMRKGANQTDRYNNNRFYHCAIEGCQNGFDLEFAYGNIFKDFRYEEGENEIIAFANLSSDCSSNIFESEVCRINIETINDGGSNEYRMPVTKTKAGRYIGNGFYTYEGNKYLINRIGDASTIAVSSYNADLYTANHIERIDTIKTGCEKTDGPITINLDDRYGMHGGYNELTLMVDFIASGGSIDILSKGVSILNDTTIEANSTYLLKWVSWGGSDNKWVIIKL